MGVERRTNGNNTGMVLREVPIQVSADDQHLQTPQSVNYFNSTIPQLMLDGFLALDSFATQGPSPEITDTFFESLYD